MKKLFIIILFALMIIPANAQSVREEIKFYGHSMTIDSQMYSIAGDHQTVQFLTNGNITCVPGNYRVEMKPYYGKRDIFGDAISSDNLRFRCSKLPAIEVVINKEKTLMIICKNINTGTIRQKDIVIYSTTPPNDSPSPTPGYTPTPSNPDYNPTPNVDQGRTCAGCGGSGVCTACGGKRGYWVESGTYTGSGSKTWHDCSSCHGTGKCGVCYGKGKIR